MHEKNNNQDFRDLRLQAEKLIKESSSDTMPEKMSLEEVRQLIHDLRVHQVELEMQNDQLRRAHEELEESHKRYFRLYEMAPVGYLTLDKDGIIQEVNLTTAHLLEKEKDEMINQPLHRFIASDEQDKYYVNYRQLKKRKTIQVCKLKMVKNNNMLHWVQMEMAAVQPRKNEETVYYIVIIDINERVQAYEKQKELQKNVEQLRDILEHQSELIVRFLPDGALTFVNEACCTYFQKKEKTLVGSNFWSFVVKKDIRPSKNQLYYLSYVNPVTTFKHQVILPCGERRWQWWAVRALFNEKKEIIEYQAVGRDITEQKRAEEKMHYLSFHDQLTGLYNRAYLEEEMKRLDTERQLPISIIMADLNGLKLVNDIYGHNKGDEMLKSTGSVLTSFCRTDDVIARWGGDEFIILLPQTKSEQVQKICRRIKEKLHGIYVEDIPVSLSLGTAFKDAAEKDIMEVLREAEDDMYKNKITESRSIRSSVLDTLMKTLEEKSYETKEHFWYMQEAALKIGNKLNLSGSELKRLELLIALHDIGKISIPEKTLTKGEPLTAEDWETIKKHPEIGYRIARSTSEFAHVAEDILAHHEHWNGSGYPQGLKGKEIPLLARIASLADAYEVMLNGRPYKKAVSRSEAAAELKRCAGTQFDPELVEIFLEILEEEPVK